jgi:nicotinate-nucleotide adenylyltransferase
MRIGILGGSFNPPHISHIELARFVIDNIPVLDEIWLMPCHKHAFGKKLLDFNHRYEMCRLAVQGYSKLNASDYERESLFGNTYRMLCCFRSDYGNFITPYMIIGMDAALEIEKWQEWEKLIKEFRFIVVDRAGYTTIGGWFMKKPHIYLKDRYNIIPELSSTDIRDQLVCDVIIPGLHINHKVLKYIKDNNLYG